MALRSWAAEARNLPLKGTDILVRGLSANTCAGRAFPARFVHGDHGRDRHGAWDRQGRGGVPRMISDWSDAMLERERYETMVRLRRKARRIELEAGRAAPTLARQLRSLAARYEAEAEELDETRKLDS